MAVNFSASGQRLTNTTFSGGAQANRTITGFLNITTNRAVYTGLIGQWSSNVAPLDYSSIVTQTGVDVGLDDSTSSTSGITITVGTWYFIALVATGGSDTIYVRQCGTTAWSTQSNTGGGDASVTVSNVVVGDSVFTGDWLAGSIGGVKMWFASLTQAELELESKQLLPYRRANLAAAYPLTSPTDLADYSGNGRTLTGGAGTTYDGTVPVPMQADRTLLRPTMVATVNRASNW